jgi:serine/threonine protein kinase
LRRRTTISALPGALRGPGKYALSISVSTDSPHLWDLSWDLGPGDELVPDRTIVRQLGHALHHEVFLVWDRARSELGAAKVMRPRWEERKRDMRQLRLEGEALAALDHPAIPRCLDVVLDGPRPHLLLGVADGMTLKELMLRQRSMPLARGLPVGQVLWFAREIADALAHLAERGYVHRDVTPENIMIGRTPWLIDLGRTRHPEPVARARRRKMGNVFRAPEIAEPGPRWGPIGPPADIFAFGGTLFYALTGRRPFPDRTRGADGRKGPPGQLSNPPARFRRPLPPGLRPLILRMLQLEPRDRPTAVEVAAELDAIARRAAGLDRAVGRLLGAAPDA